MKDKLINFLKSPLITEILLFILGVILFTNPENIIKVATCIIGGLFILLGFIRLANYLGDKKRGIINNNDLSYAIAVATCGIIIITCADIIESVLRVIMGGFILYNGIVRLNIAIKIKGMDGVTWKGHLIIAIAIICIGLYIIFKENLVFSGIGLFIMFYSGLEIVLYIISNYENNKVIIKKNL